MPALQALWQRAGIANNDDPSLGAVPRATHSSGISMALKAQLVVFRRAILALTQFWWWLD
jgi:hypothetical protein